MKEKILDICGTTDKLALILSGGEVKRYHQEGNVFPQPVSDHTWRALVVLLHFWPDISREVVLAMVYHDVAERYTGDIPATVKINNPEISKSVKDMEVRFMQFLNLPSEHDLSSVDYHRLKCAEYIELCITCRTQTGRESGKRPWQIYKRGIALVNKFMLGLPEEERVQLFELIGLLETNRWGGDW